MRLLLSSSCCSCNQNQSLLRPAPAKRLAAQKTRWPRMMDGSNRRRHRRTEKMVVIMGATGTGKSRLSIDIASTFPSEIINADKMQVYRGLDITTNKILFPDRAGVPHHLLGDVDPSNGDFSPADFRSLAASVAASISARHLLPLLVGGSNSFIHAFLSDRYEPGPIENLVSVKFRYDCCFLWVDVSMPVLFNHLDRRVDEMLDSGMFHELAAFYNPDDADKRYVGIRKAIGVPEFDRYFQSFPPDMSAKTHPEKDLYRQVLYREAVEAIKENTRQLAMKQIEKIQRLRSSGWDLNRIDATEAFVAALASDSGRFRDAWEKNVVGPSVKIVKRFLAEHY